MFDGQAAFAATKTWTGSGGNSNLATAGNWQGGVAPVDGDSLAFGSGSSLTLNNDLSSSIVVDGFDTGRTVSINGAELKVKGNFTSSQDGSFTFNNTLNVTDDVIISARFVNFGGDLIGNGDITQGYTGQYKGTL